MNENADLTKNPVGRPKKWTEEKIIAEGKALLKWYEADENRLWLKDFAIKRGYSPQRLSDWAKVSEEFLESLQLAKAIEESRLVNGALKNKFNPQFTFRALANVAGWRDSKDLNVGGQPDNPLRPVSPDEYEARLRQDLALIERTKAAGTALAEPGEVDTALTAEGQEASI